MSQAREISTPAAIPFAEQIWLSHGGESLSQIALQLANDILRFDDHLLYLEAQDSSRLTWTYRHGADVDPRRSAFGELATEKGQRFARCAEFLTRLRNGEWQFLAVSPSSGKSRQLCFVPLSAERAHGFLAVCRIVREGLHPAPLEFTEDERHILAEVSFLLGAALGDDPPVAELVDQLPTGWSERASVLLRSLHLHCLHHRSHLQESTVRNILREYLDKTVGVIHDLRADQFAAPGSCRDETIRLTAKLTVNTGAGLRIVECLSSAEDDWTDVKKNTPYPFHSPEEGPGSFAALSCLIRRVQRVNDYRDRAASQYRLFPDTESHMSAPIYAGVSDALGSISVETTRSRAYDRLHESAFGLLAAHAAGPIRNALRRERDQHEWYDRAAKLFADELLEPGLGMSDALLIERFTRAVESEYEVVDFGQTATGESALGRTVCHEPHTRTYSILDDHDRPVWVVTVRRRDRFRMNDIDARVILGLGLRLVRAWQEAQQVRFVHRLTNALVATSFFSLNALLRQCADMIAPDTGEWLVRRARVFEIDEHGRQTPHHQSGQHQVPDFAAVVLGDRDREILSADRPILFVRAGSGTHLASCDEFLVVLEVGDVNEIRLLNQGRTQWVEIPIRLGVRVVAKLVLDHIPCPPGKDAFTRGEMYLLAHLSRLLSVVAECVEAYKALAKLCIQGLQSALISHSLTRLINRTSVPSLHGFLRKLNSYLRPQSEEPPVRLREVLKDVEDACRFFQERYELHGFVLELSPAPDDVDPGLAAEDAGAFFLILATMVDNSLRAIGEQVRLARGAVSANQTQADGVRPKLGIRAEILRYADAPLVTVRLEDLGPGLTPELAKAIRQRLSNPAAEMGKGIHTGLVLAGFLAKHYNWSLQLVHDQNPTVFELDLPLEQV